MKKNLYGLCLAGLFCALVAAAAGMAFKNRGKLSELRRKDTGGTSTTPTGVDNNASTPPATPAV